MNIKSHKPLGNKKNKWAKASADFSSNNYSLEIFGNPIIEAWERPYMKKLAEITTSNKGIILEVGWGLGIASSYIQKSKVSEHHIIEANNNVFDKLSEFSKTAKIKIFKYKGLWQDQIKIFKKNFFDGILYDTYPLNESELHTHQFKFIKKAYNLLKPNGVLTYCNFTSWGNLRKVYGNDYDMFNLTQIPELKKIGFKNIKLNQVKVNPPKSCNYYQFNTIIAPIIKK